MAMAFAPGVHAQPEPVPAVSALIDRTAERVAGALAQVGDALSNADLFDHVIRFRVDVRDALRTAETWLVAWAGPLAAQPVDLAPLVSSPVPEVSSSGFGWRRDPINRRRKFHMGADYAADRGTPVLAAGDGVVILAGRHNGYGRTVIVDHGGGLVTRYAHLQTIAVERGAVVSATDRVGTVGSSGRATGPHLHFEVRVEGRPVDPGMAMQIAEMARTSPELAKVAAMALAPEIQEAILDEEDPVTWRRRSSGRRSNAVW
jgi:murein DD-endopeptidase MepM/ murein hydrolase activator NlpD